MRYLRKLAFAGTLAAFPMPEEAHAQRAADALAWETTVKKGANTPRAPHVMEKRERTESAGKSALDTTYGAVLPPQGFRKMCEGFSSACEEQNKSAKELVRRREVSDHDMARLQELNQQVNRHVLPVSDADGYGTEEHWAANCASGDCEDVALCKRWKLLQEGWKPEQLIMVVLTLPSGEGHAVLGARTSRGDFMLDNQLDNVSTFNDAVRDLGYKLQMRQSPLHPELWLALNPALKNKTKRPPHESADVHGGGGGQ